MSMHNDKERLDVAEAMAKDFLNVYRSCTYKEMTDIERENLERIAVLARQVMDDPNEYRVEEDDPSFGC